MRPGVVVADRFCIERLAGAGGMGTVYRARDQHSGDLVAMKVLREGGEDRARRFAVEAEVLHKLRHPRIVRYIAHGKTPDNKLFLVMEWLEGETLGQLLRRKTLALDDAYDVALALSKATGIAHDHGVLHRDIKPGNIVLVNDDIKRLKLLDFGLARSRDASVELTNTGELLGTPGYMSPEQARGEKGLDARADVFSMGCVLFRCFTGRRAFEGKDALAVLAKLILETPPRVSTLREGIPPQLDGLIARMLCKSREDRPANGQAVHQELLAMESAVRGSELASLSPMANGEGLPSITVKEQRVVCLVLARLDGPMAGGVDTRTADSDQQAIARVAEAVHAFGGTAYQLIDGTLMVTVSAGAPAEQAARAGRCAFALRKCLGAVPTALTAGRSMVAVGAVLGEAIDRAAALLHTGNGADVRLNDAAAALMRDRFAVERDQQGYVLKSMRAADDYARKLLGRETSFVGRRRELRNLEALFEESVGEPVARAVLVTAPAGVGKSRLRYELLRRLRQRGTVQDEDGSATPFQVWLGRGDPMGAGAAFGMIANALRHATDIRIGEPLELRQLKLMKRVRKHVHPSSTRRVAEFLGELIGVPFEEQQSVQLRAARQDPMVMGDQMRRAVEDFILAECTALPVLIVLEDLHWGDRPSISIIDSALRNLSESPLMVLAFARPEVHDLFPGLWAERDLQEVRLSRLTRKASAKLVEQVLGDTSTPALVERLVERADGNAFYLEELIRAVAEGKGDALPESVLAMVESRLHELEGEARRVLRAASIYGQVFWRDGVKALVGDRRQHDLEDWLVALEERELITKRQDTRFPDDTEYVFRHALLREAAYAALTENDRELGHRLAGTWLEDAGEKESRVLAEHFERGDDALRAVRWYQRATEQALEGNDLEAALQSADRGVRCGATKEALGRLRLLQADAHRWRGEFAEMEARGLVAMAMLPAGEAAWCKAVAEIAVACRALSHYERLVEVAEALQKLKPLPHFEAAYTEACARTAMQLFMIGWTRHGDALLSRIADAEQVMHATHPSVLAWTHHASASRALYAGDAGSYLRLSEQAALKFEAAGNLRGAVNAKVYLGFGYIEVGGYGEAQTALQDALTAAKRMGLHNVVASSMNNLGMAQARLGQLDEAIVTETEAIVLATAQGDQRMAGASRHYLAIVRLLRGEHVLAEAEAEAAAAVLEISPSLRAHALATLARAQLALDRPASALETAREAMALLTTLGGIEEGETLVRLVLAEARHASGDRDAATCDIAEAVARLRTRAEQITDDHWRKSFLERVPDNARTLALAARWQAQPCAIADEDTSEEQAPSSTAGDHTSSAPPEC